MMQLFCTQKLFQVLLAQADTQGVTRVTVRGDKGPYKPVRITKIHGDSNFSSAHEEKQRMSRFLEFGSKLQLESRQTLFFSVLKLKILDDICIYFQYLMIYIFF